MGILRKSGWKPRRTVMVCLWDGEEPGLLGSTEFTEDYAKELSEKAVLYLNSDSNGRGFLQAGGSHILESLVNESAAEVQDPETRLGVQAREFHHQLQQATEAELRTELRKAGQFRLGALGSGSDYTAFLDHLGIPSLDLGFGGEGGGGEYHSIYDSFSMYMRFGDSTLAYGRALAQTAGTVMLRVANAAVLPYDFTSQAATIRRYLQEVQKLHKTRQDEAREVNQKLEEGTILAMMDPRAPTVAPAARPVAPDQDFSGLEAAVAGLEEAAKQYALAAEGVARSKDPIENAGVEELNSLLRTTERKLLDSRGLPGRPWFQHLLYAPGLFTGYGVKTIPGVRESIEQADWKELPLQLTRLVAVLHEETTLVRAATAELRRLVP